MDLAQGTLKIVYQGTTTLISLFFNFFLKFSIFSNSFNSYVCDNTCIHEFIKQVFPKFLKPFNKGTKLSNEFHKIELSNNNIERII